MKIHRVLQKINLSQFITAVILLSFITRAAYPQISGMPDALMQKGMCYVTWDKTQLLTPYSDKSLEKLVSIGAEYIALCPTFYQERHDSTVIKRTDQTPSDKSLFHAIKKAHELGLKIMLKPHLDLIDNYDGTYWRADIGFFNEQDWQKWFREYEKFITHYADMAERLGVEIFCVGTELSFAAQRASDWQNLIDEIRKIYCGKLTYAANWDDFKNVKFWKNLDYAGIDAYFPLTYKISPSVEDLKIGWEKWKQEIAEWHTLINKPVIFTEIGYASSSSAPHSPWKSGETGNADMGTQAKCYKAFFETIWNEPWLRGVYWWKWDAFTQAGGKNNRHFTPQNKPAQNIIKENYIRN